MPMITDFEYNDIRGPIEQACLNLNMERPPIELVGSARILGEGNDIDVALFVPNEELRESILELARIDGWNMQGAGYEPIVAGNNFTSIKKGIYNLLICADQVSWDRFTVGARLCVFLQGLGVPVEDKRVRVAIHALAGGEGEEGVLKSVRRVG